MRLAKISNKHTVGQAGHAQDREIPVSTTIMPDAPAGHGKERPTSAETRDFIPTHHHILCCIKIIFLC